MFDRIENKSFVHELWYRESVLNFWTLVATLLFMFNFHGLLRVKDMELGALPWILGVSIVTWIVALYQHNKIGLKLINGNSDKPWEECKKIFPYVNFFIMFKLFTMVVYGGIPLGAGAYFNPFGLYPVYVLFICLAIVNIILDLYVIMQMAIADSRI